ncbi:MAG: protein kinase [Polyangiaceae bacterium]
MSAEPAPAEGSPKNGDATSPSDRPYAEGDVLDGRYRLVSLLGRGGFGDVWRADELLPDGTPFRQVALKLLAPHVTDAASWVEEAKLLASFRHPSLVTIFATGVFHGAGPQPFVAMELLEGCTLADVLQDKGPTPWRRVLAWAREAAGALDVIHERGVVHLDLKPANLFLHKDGTIKVLDFGIARKAKPPVGKPREEKAEPPSSRLSYLMPPPKAEPARAGAAQAVTGRMSLSGALSRREAELGTAAFMVEQALDVNKSAAGAIAASAAGDTAQNHTPEAYAQTFAMDGTTDALGATHAIGATTARAIIGTPGYMAPEIFEQSEPSAATDAYALGVVIAVLTTGQLPLDVPDEPEGGWSNPTAITSWWAAIRTATLRGEMRDLRQGKAHLPAGLVRLLRKLFAVDAAARGVVPGKLGALLDEVWERPFGVPDPPFPGPVPMSGEHEGFLFGREEEITRLGRDLEHEPCVVLLGPRAVGKTSLALAGLVPHLAKRGVDGKEDWRAVVLRDPARGDEALDEALAIVDEKLAGASIEDVIAACEARRDGLAIVVDPLESLASASVETRARLGELLSLMGDGHVRPGLRVIGVLGEPRIGAVQATAFGQALRASMRYVGPPSPQAAASLVNRPIKLARAEATGIEPIVSEVQREVGVPGLLPFVAQALADFWAARERITEPKDRIVLRGQRWTDLRGVVGAIGRAGDAALEDMNNADRALAEELLLFLTATDGTLVKWREDELMEAFGHDGDAAARVLGALVNAGLVRRQDGAIELLHEGIVEGWRRLQSLRHRHLVRLAFVERIRESTHAWEKSAKSGEMRIRGNLLADVIAKPEWMERGLVARERDLVKASLRAARNRRLAKVGGAVAAVLFVVLLVAAKGYVDHQRALADQERAEADHRAYVFDLVARSRRTDDPFQRVALMAEAMKEGSNDGLLPVELADAVANVPRARFLTLESVSSPSFDWEDRWLVAGGTSTTLLLVDMRPPDSVVIEDLDLDVDPDKVKRKSFSPPHVHALRPFDEPIAERVPFAFDSAFAVRSVQGAVRVFRLTDKGQVELAAVAPMKCTGAMRIAAAAPVLACATDAGIAAWDLRKPAGANVIENPWKGAVADVSPDGSVVAAIAEKAMFLWRPGGGTTMEIGLNESLVLARMSPRDRVVAAITTTAVEIYDIDHAREPLVRVEHRVPTASARWDAGGLDLGLCGRDGRSAWVYLRKGPRAPTDAKPEGSPCLPAPGKRVPTRITKSEDLGDFADLALGSRPAFDAFKLPDGRLVTRELVVFDEPKRAARSLLWFRGKDASGAETPVQPGAAVASVVRDGPAVLFQVGADIQAYEADSGKLLLTKPGNLLRRCDDGRIAAWSKGPAGYRVFDTKTNATLGEIPKEPLLVLGVDAKCTALFVQALDGTITARALGASAPPQTIAVADGYVFDVRPSAARAGVGPGLYLLVSSGAIARIDDATRTLRLLGYATPRATAVADGPAPGEVLFSDATGVLLLRATGSVDRVSETDADAAVTDVATSPDGNTILFLAGKKLHVLDVARGERRVTSAKERERILAWDEEGSVLLWSSDRAGPAEGTIVPRAKALALRVAQASSNLAVDHGAIVIKP